MKNRDITAELLEALKGNGPMERVTVRVPKQILEALELLRQSLESSERRRITQSDLIRGCVVLLLKHLIDLPCHIPLMGTASLGGHGRKFEVRVMDQMTLIAFPHAESDAQKVWPFVQLALSKFEPYIPGFEIAIEPLSKLPKDLKPESIPKETGVKRRGRTKEDQLSLAK